jgi:signal transduction histidine kinase
MHWHFNPHTILPIICMFLAISCGIFVVSQNPRAKLNRIFFTICITFAAWFSFYIPFNLSIKEDSLILWFKISYCFISFIPIACFTFITTYLNAPKNIFWYRINSLIGCSFCFMSLFTDLIIKGVNYFRWHPYPKAGVAHSFLIIHCVYLSYFSIHLIVKAMNTPNISSRQINHLRYMLAAIFVLSLGAFDFIENYGIPLYSTGYIAASSFLLIVTIAIVKHQLMDIQIVIRKSLIYSILVSFLTLIFFMSVLVVDKISQNYIDSHQNILNSALLSLIIAIIFIPLRNKIQNFIDRIFFKATPIQIAEENELLRQEVFQTERLKAVATLASGMAHEIKNPLTVIKTFSEYLPQKLDDKEFLRKFAPLISQEVNRIDNLVHDLLDFARPADPILKPVNIQNLIDSTLELLSNDCLKFNVKIVKDYHLSSNAYLQLDYNQIKQALLNIFLNAIEAMPHGGQLHLSTNFNTNRNMVFIKIQDTGRGIEQKDIGHIFDPFFSKKDHGTGLGLSITYEIIKNHKGKIFVESSVGKGTTFILEFPFFK